MEVFQGWNKPRGCIVCDLSPAADMFLDSQARCLSFTNPVPLGGAKEVARSSFLWQEGVGTQLLSPWARGQEQREAVDVQFIKSTAISHGLLHSHSDTHTQVHAFRQDLAWSHTQSHPLSETQSLKSTACLMPHFIITATKIATGSRALASFLISCSQPSHEVVLPVPSFLKWKKPRLRVVK